MRLETSGHPYRGILEHEPQGPVAPIALERDDALFGCPVPILAWTGAGIRTDHRDRIHAVRHAMERSAALALRPDAESVPKWEVPKLLAIQQLRGQPLADLRSWFIERCYSEIGTRRATIVHVLSEVRRDLSEGEHWSICYEPRGGRTTISWPWGTRAHFYDRAFMRSIWGAFFCGSSQPGLGRSLLRELG